LNVIVWRDESYQDEWNHSIIHRFCKRVNPVESIVSLKNLPWNVMFAHWYIINLYTQTWWFLVDSNWLRKWHWTIRLYWTDNTIVSVGDSIYVPERHVIVICTNEHCWLRFDLPIVFFSQHCKYDQSLFDLSSIFYMRMQKTWIICRMISCNVFILMWMKYKRSSQLVRHIAFLFAWSY
jgi:hypothetical protein